MNTTAKPPCLGDDGWTSRFDFVPEVRERFRAVPAGLGG